MLGNRGRSATQAVFTPIARVLARLGISPNMVTLAGTFITVVLSITLLARGYLWQGGIALGLVLLADSIDGILARLTNTVSPFGAFFDSTMDRIGDGAVFGSLLLWIATQMPSGLPQRVALIAGVVSIVGVGVVPYVRARAESVGVIAKIGIAERTDRLIVALTAAGLTGLGAGQWWIAVGLVLVAVGTFVTVVQRIMYTSKELSS
ncbi:MAG: CDP-alcohol phosphatidyltransferase [Actinobacteria bacterium]|nr:MAG: CDP-alcohol phosphatidyltransferase [Actinomycetota bacterium]